MDKLRQKFIRKMRELTDVMAHVDLTHIYRTFCPNIEEYTFFSVPHGTFSKTNHILGIKANLNRYKIIWITPSILSNHHGLKSEFNNTTNCRKPTNSWKINSVQLNHPWVKGEIKKEIRDFLEFNENEGTMFPNLWDSMKAMPRGKFIALSAYIKKVEKFQTRT